MTDQTIPADKLRALLDGEGSAADKIQAIYDDLLPPVLPDPLFGARATHPTRGEGIVISHFPDGSGEVRFMFRYDGNQDGTQCVWMNPGGLTFHTPDTPGHPVFLETEEEYRSAPVGTIVAEDCTASYTKTIQSWLHPHKNPRDDSDMAGVRRRVLRWRWEA